MQVHDIFTELNESNSSNYKLSVLKKHAENKMLARVLQMTYDKVLFTYGCTLPNVLKHEVQANDPDVEFTLSTALDLLAFTVCTKKVTGHEALKVIKQLLLALNETDRIVVERVLDRNIRCNVGTTQMNKVFPGLITKPVYMRCGVYSEKTAKKIKFPATLQIKADGTYREFTVENGEVRAASRSGESYSYPILNAALSKFSNGVYFGELTVKGCTNRAIGNGMLNSGEVPHDDVVLDVWDYVTAQEYKNASEKIKNVTPYDVRFSTLCSIVKQNSVNVRVIESVQVVDIRTALKQVQTWMQQGLEGGVLKNNVAVFKNGTSQEQLKLKLQIDGDFRICGFSDGKVGSKRQGKVGAIEFCNDERTVRGRCSGFTDKVLNDMTENPNKYLGFIFTVEFNDVTKSKNNDFHALSHPRFVEMRPDKTETDTLERVQQCKNMAMLLN